MINRPLPQAVLTPSKVPGRSGVAPFADGEVVTAKRALAVMARHAACRSTRRVMIERLRRRNLSALRHAGPDLVALGAGDFFML
jgi:hypothetical protein